MILTDMKKSLFIICTLLCFAASWAQKVTEKELQGKWKLISYTVTNATLDVETGKVTVVNPNDTSASLKKDLEGFADDLKTAYIEIQGNNFYQIITDAVKNGPFTLDEKNGIQSINAAFDDGTNEQLPFIMKEGNLHFKLRHNKTYVYKKV